MGRDKALLLLDGEPLVARALRTLSGVCAEVAIGGGREELSRFGRVIPDERAECGPLGGIVSALEQSRFEWNLFLAVDTPFVPLRALGRLLGRAAESTGVCVMAKAGGELQPLCAVYARRALPVLRDELDAGRWKVTKAIAAAGVCELVEFEEADWFRNLNTPAEFAEAVGIKDPIER
jgi:molybdopterin-guanine dinucleotide biosynthesis protein A